MVLREFRDRNLEEGDPYLVAVFHIGDFLVHLLDSLVELGGRKLLLRGRETPFNVFVARSDLAIQYVHTQRVSLSHTVVLQLT